MADVADEAIAESTSSGGIMATFASMIKSASRSSLSSRDDNYSPEQDELKDTAKGADNGEYDSSEDYDDDMEGHVAGEVSDAREIYVKNDVESEEEASDGEAQMAGGERSYFSPDVEDEDDDEIQEAAEKAAAEKAAAEEAEKVATAAAKSASAPALPRLPMRRGKKKDDSSSRQASANSSESSELTSVVPEEPTAPSHEDEREANSNHSSQSNGFADNKPSLPARRNDATGPAPQSGPAAAAAAPALPSRRPAAPAMAPSSAMPRAQSASSTIRSLATQPASASRSDGTDASAVEMTAAQRVVREKIHEIRIKLCRCAKRLGINDPRESQLCSQVLYRLQLAEKLKAGEEAMKAPGFSTPDAIAEANALENSEENKPLDLELTLLAVGKSGIGKTATINSLFEGAAGDLGSGGLSPEVAADPFESGTRKCRRVAGTIHGIPVTVIDTPGLHLGLEETPANASKMKRVRNFISGKKFGVPIPLPGGKPEMDILLYFDRLDTTCRDMTADLPLMDSVTNSLGQSAWFNAILCLTHAENPPPEMGPSSTQMQFDYYQQQRANAIQMNIRRTAGDPRLLNPVALIENHPDCARNDSGERILPTNAEWRTHLLLLAVASKTLIEANAFLNLQDGSGKSGGASASAAAAQRAGRHAPLPFLLSALITPRPPRKLEGEDNSGDNASEDIVFGNSIDEKNSNGEFEEMAPPAKPQIEVPQLDPILPPTFDADPLAYRYRFVDMASQWVARPVVDPHGYDHEADVSSFNFEKVFIAENVINAVRHAVKLDSRGNNEGAKEEKRQSPCVITGSLGKDKKDQNVQVEIESSVWHKPTLVTTAGVDIQNGGGNGGIIYTGRAETRLKSNRHFKTAIGGSLSTFQGSHAQGLKIEEKLKYKPGVKATVAAGTVSATSASGKRENAWGANVEMALDNKDLQQPKRLTVGSSAMYWKRDLALAFNCNGQVPVGDSTVNARASLNSRGQGQIALRASSNERMQIAAFALIPLFSLIFGRTGDVEE